MIADLLHELNENHFRDISDSPESVKRFLESVNEYCLKNNHQKSNNHDDISLSSSAPKSGTWGIDLTVVTDFSLQAIILSDAAHHILGYSIGEQPNGQNFLDRIHPSDKEYVLNTILSTIRQQKEKVIAFRLSLPSGSNKVIRFTATAIFDKKNKIPQRISGSIKDITENRFHHQSN
jgi:PAS domain S-box-containing protein